MMLASLQNHLALSTTALALAVSVVLLASLVRGFAGFGLSALIMAGLTLLIPPVSLIPLCFMLELLAGVLMARGSFANADRKISWSLALFSTIGLPIGLLATINIPTTISRTIALILILFLALMQLRKQAPGFLSTSAGLYSAGLAAGISAGLASVGGMVVALYVLAQQAPARQMRASVATYLFLTMFTSLITLTLSGLLDLLAVKRALFLAPVVIVGVTVGSWLFKPGLEQIYKRFCLGLLIGLALMGLVLLAVQRL
jgi:uncharacterized membrane protein YfcA